jgi:hypothetical protein
MALPTLGPFALVAVGLLRFMQRTEPERHLPQTLGLALNSMELSPRTNNGRPSRNSL